jgi:pilus assembly protein Flp/PilA
MIKRFLVSEDGPTATEYAVMLALIIGLALGSLSLFGNNASGLWGNNASEINSSMNGGS